MSGGGEFAPDDIVQFKGNSLTWTVVAVGVWGGHSTVDLKSGQTGRLRYNVRTDILVMHTPRDPRANHPAGKRLTEPAISD